MNQRIHNKQINKILLKPRFKIACDESVEIIMEKFNEHKRTSNNTPLSELVDKLMRAYRLDGKMKELDIIAAWPEMMGPAVNNRTKKITIRNKTLFLVLDSAVMREELQHGKKIIIDRVNEKAGSIIITDVYFG